MIIHPELGRTAACPILLSWNGIHSQRKFICAIHYCNIVFTRISWPGFPFQERQDTVSSCLEPEIGLGTPSPTLPLTSGASFGDGHPMLLLTLNCHVNRVRGVPTFGVLRIREFHGEKNGRKTNRKRRQKRHRKRPQLPFFDPLQFSALEPKTARTRSQKPIPKPSLPVPIRLPK